MSCTVKISSSNKNWSGPAPRRINSLAEEASSSSTSSSANYQTASNSTSLSKSCSAPQRGVKSIAAKKGEDTSKLLKYIDDSIIGKSATFFGPFGRRKVVYCDYTASGRSLQFLEDYIVKEVLPYLGDTRASTSICSLQSSLFRHEARDIVRHAVGANEQDIVLFTGHGSLGALRTLVRHLNLSEPTVVFVGSFESDMSLKPWKDYGVEIIRISDTREGFLDLNDLERHLAKERAKGASARRMIGFFTAASSITGVLADDVATTLLLGQYGALSVWDYTSAAPYISVNMNPHLPGVEKSAVHKDVIIFAGHKYVGGLQSPSVLVMKRSLLNESTNNHECKREMPCGSDNAARDPEICEEETGTAGVVETIRCGLAVHLKESLTNRAIISRLDRISKQVLAHVRTIPELILLGNPSHNVKRLPIFSFMFRHPRGSFLHHNFACAVLNDVFGIQVRGGCTGAGLYAHELMGIDQELSGRYDSALIYNEQSIVESSLASAEALKPGFARISFPFFMPDVEVAFVLEALKMVATEGWKLLPQYILNLDTGEWRHHTNGVFKERKWLGSIRYTDGKMITSDRRVSGSQAFPQSYNDCLQTARNIFNRARKMAQRRPLQVDQSHLFVDESLRWFMLPCEAQELLLGRSQNVKQRVPFDPANSGYVTYNHSECRATSGGKNFCDKRYLMGMRRVNSDETSRVGNAHSTWMSPRHQSLPLIPSALLGSFNSSDYDCCDGETAIVANAENNHQLISSDATVVNNISSSNLDKCCAVVAQQQSHNGRSDSPMPTTPLVRFAVGEAVHSSALIGKNSEGQHRCNSLGSNDERYACYSTDGSSHSSSPVPIPLGPQTLASLGLSVDPLTSTFTRTRQQSNSVGSQTELSSLDSDIIAPMSSSRTHPTSAGSSSSSSVDLQIYNGYGDGDLGNDCSSSSSSSSSSAVTAVTLQTFAGRSSSPCIGHNCENDISAYLKEVTKELATEIKSEIREVISKVDDALSENNTTENTPQHHSRYLGVNLFSTLEDRRRNDSFTANDVADYLLSFSKEMASEMKSEIRCMVSGVDGLNRLHSPAFAPRASSLGSAFVAACDKSPAERRKRKRVSSFSKQADVSSKTADKYNNDDEYEEFDRGSTSGRGFSKLHDKPKIYSAVNSASSQDSGINLSFHENDRLLEAHSADNAIELKRSSSADSNPCNSQVRRPRTFTMPSISRISRQQIRESDSVFSEDETSSSSYSKQETGETKRKKEIRFESDEPDLLRVHVAGSPIDSPVAKPPRWIAPAKSVWKSTVDAIREFDMIRDKDRVLIYLSDDSSYSSFTLLHTLHQYQCYAKSKGIEFEIGAVTIMGKNSDYSTSQTIESYLKALGGVYYHSGHDDFMGLIHDRPYLVDESPSDEEHRHSEEDACCICNKNMRMHLYALAQRYGYNVLALSKNFDDLIQDFLVSLFHHGKMKATRANYQVIDGNLRIIKPFIYVMEKELRHFFHNQRVPSISMHHNCSAYKNALKERWQLKELMTEQERTHPRLYWSLRSALRPLIRAHSDHDKTTYSA